MVGKKRVILITDGDDYALKAIENVATDIGGTCLTHSHGNPTVLTGPQMVKEIKKAKHEPVFVMFDDSGMMGEGPGEKALLHVANHPDIEVIGVIAVASRTRKEEWTRVNVSIDRDGVLTENGVDKYGIQEFGTRQAVWGYGLLFG